MNGLRLLVGICCLVFFCTGRAYADNVFVPASASIAVGSAITAVSYAASSDNVYYRVLSTTSGIDTTLTINNVELEGANTLYVHYDGSVSSNTLSYLIQIRDFTNSTWRTLNQHGTALTNTTDSGAGLIYQPAAAVFTGTEFAVYDGAFSSANTPISTPLTNFLNGSNQVQIRFVSVLNAANIELRIDYLAVEPAVENQLYASSMTNTAGGTVTNQYTDTTTDDNATNLQVAANGSGVDFYLTFSGAPTPYTGANTILVELSSFLTTLTNYSVSIRDFVTGGGTWVTLSSTPLTNSGDATNYFATSTATPVTNFISSGQIRVRISSASTTGSVAVDFARVTIGSTATDTGDYTATYTRGSLSSGTLSNAANVDTSAAASSWVIGTSNTDARTTTEYAGDCNTATNHCLAANVLLPMTIPANSTVTGIHTFTRYVVSAAALDVEFGIFDRRLGRVAYTPATGVDEVALHMLGRTLAYPMPPQIGNDAMSTVPVYLPYQMPTTVLNGLRWYVRTTASNTSAQTLTMDFLFASIRTIGPERSITAAWSPTGGLTTTGTNTASNPRFTYADDNSTWVIAPSASVVDAYMIFPSVSIPSGANKLFVQANISCSAASGSYKLYLRDFSASSWREINNHGTSINCATGEGFLQYEIFNGYFSNGSNAAVSTPLSNFVSGGGEVWLRVLSASTANIQIDTALLEITKDPVYFASGMTLTAGSRAQQYSDTYTDDNATNLVISNSGGIDAYFSFTGVLTPPTGSNTILIPFSAFHTGASGYNIFIRNFTTDSWEQLNRVPFINTGDATNYLSKSVTTWSDYISSGEIRIRMTTTAAAGSLTIDYLKVMLGSANTDSAGSSIDIGSSYIGDVQATRSVDTSQYYHNRDTWRIRSFPNNSTRRVYDAPSAFALRVNFPLTLPSNASPVGIIYAYRGATSANTALTLTPTFLVSKNGYSDATNVKASQVSATAAPTALDTITLATSTVTYREGVFMTNVVSTSTTNVPDIPNAFDTTNNMLTMRFRTSASTSFTSAVFDFGFVFVGVRYVD